MRKLLNTLFVLTPECYLSLDGETVVVHRDKTEMARFPLHTLEGILSFTYAGASPAYKLFDAVQITRNEGVTVPRSYRDYTVTVAEPLPAGVTCLRMG